MKRYLLFLGLPALMMAAVIWTYIDKPLVPTNEPTTVRLYCDSEKPMVETLDEYASELADDKYEGRESGYEGNRKAAKYIASKFKEFGLKPIGDDGTYFQNFIFNAPNAVILPSGHTEIYTANVVGMLEGSDPVLKNEIVVVGAHFDHVGMHATGYHYGRLGATRLDSIYNGADDNASGTAVIMVMARILKLWGLKRSVVFIAFSGEEAGLYGSKYYCSNPPRHVDISKHVFMLNMDMVGRNPDKPVEVKGLGSAHGDILRDVVKASLSHANLRANIEDGGEVSGGDSDHSSFRDIGVPYTFFFTGFHPDYHKTSDHANKLAYDLMAKEVHAAVHIISDIANLPERLTFKK